MDPSFVNLFNNSPVLALIERYPSLMPLDFHGVPQQAPAISFGIFTSTPAFSHNSRNASEVEPPKIVLVHDGKYTTDAWGFLNPVRTFPPETISVLIKGTLFEIFLSELRVSALNVGTLCAKEISELST